MEPNKLEKQIKEQLNSREIQPSAMAWDKLDVLLTAAAKPKRKFSRMYIAASFFGFLLIGSFYFRQNANGFDNVKNKVVLEKGIVPEPNTKTSIVLKIKNKPNYVGGKIVVKGNSTPNKTLAQKEKSIVNEIILNQNQVVEVSIRNQKSEQKSIKPLSITVTIDELLAAVEMPTRNENQLNPKQVVHVNAGNLLSQVDGELELSFREKVINKVSKNYQTVKVAIVNRNLE